MTKEDIKKFMPLMQAMLEGKTIQRHLDDMGWVYTDKIFVGDGVSLYRIKPEPKYRPFKSREECWDEMLKHQPFGWAKNIDTGDLCNISNIYESAGCAKVFLDTCAYTFSSLLNEFTFIDGTPFGIKEE